MHKLFHRFGRKDTIKILRRELAFAHTCIALLSLGMIALLSIVASQVTGLNQTLLVVASTLLTLVMLISVGIVAYILKTKK